ncbi:DUF4259 domain-containing protein [Kribbella sp. NPDC006257]|uniref:DUF4259 domain-containing protein n=1 Tax=Kribbella sp. NPDC006257 TaxID=3156738 RepID=UPI0033A209D6
MSRWGYLPFENDTAADFADDLDEAPESERLGRLAAALSVVAAGDGHIDAGRAEVAIAAAAIVVRDLPWGDRFQTSEEIPTQWVPVLSPDLLKLATGAIDRLLKGDNDLSDDWSGEADGGQWVGTLRQLGRVLSGEDAEPPEKLF